MEEERAKSIEKTIGIKRAMLKYVSEPVDLRRPVCVSEPLVISKSERKNAS